MNTTMKAYPVLLGILAASMARGFAADPMSEALQKGLLAEEASQNPQAAIQAYQFVLKQYEEQRRIAATAAFRLGETYRKLGKTNEAFAQFERVLREFESEDALASLSRKYLNEAGLAPSAAGAGAAAAVDPEQTELLKQEIALIQQQIAEQEKRFENGRIAQAELWQTQRQLFPLFRKLPENAAPKRQEDLIKAEIELVQKTLANVRKMFEAGVASSADRLQLERDLLSLQRQLLAARPPAAAGFQTRLKSIVKRSDELTTTDEETKEIQRIRNLIRNSPDLINARGESGITELYKAARAGNLMVVRFLLDSNADVNAGAGSHPGTPLHAAAEAGNKAMVELLLSRGANVNAEDGNGETPLHQAAAKGYQVVAQVLLAKGAEVNARQRDGTTPMHYAVGGNHRAMVELLLANGADINAAGPRETTPLFTAVANSLTELASLLLEKGADVNARDEKGSTPLAWAVRKNNLDMVKLLLSKGADPNAKDLQGLTPLSLAIAPWFERTADPSRANRPDTANLRGVFEAFVAKGANLKDAKALPVIMQASELGNIEQVRQLLELGVDVNSRFDEGFTALHAAAASGHTNIVDLLLAKGADVNAQDEFGNTPLHYAVFTVRKPVVERLLAAGARIDLQNLDGQVPERMFYDPRSAGNYSRKWGIPVKQSPIRRVGPVFGAPSKLTPQQAEIQDLFDRTKKAGSPASPDSANPGKQRQCINQLRQIEGAKQMWALENRKSDSSVPAATDLNAYLKGGAMPVCPAGGQYTLGAVSEQPKCDVPGHSLR